MYMSHFQCRGESEWLRGQGVGVSEDDGGREELRTAHRAATAQGRSNYLEAI